MLWLVVLGFQQSFCISGCGTSKICGDRCMALKPWKCSPSKVSRYTVSYRGIAVHNIADTILPRLMYASCRLVAIDCLSLWLAGFAFSLLFLHFCYWNPLVSALFSLKLIEIYICMTLYVFNRPLKPFMQVEAVKCWILELWQSFCAVLFFSFYVSTWLWCRSAPFTG